MKQQRLLGGLGLCLVLAGCSTPQPSASGAPSAPSQGTATPTTAGQILPAPAPAVASVLGNYDDLVEGAKIRKREYATFNEVRTELGNQFTKMMNFQPSEAELQASESFVSESGKTGPEAVAESYRHIFTSIIFRDSGQFQGSLETLGAQTFARWYETRGEENPFEVTFKYNPETRFWELTDNSNHNSIIDDPIGSAYIMSGDIKFAFINETTTKEGDMHYTLPGNAPYIKQGAIPNE